MRSSPFVAVISSNRVRCMVQGYFNTHASEDHFAPSSEERTSWDPLNHSRIAANEVSRLSRVVVRERVGAHPTCSSLLRLGWCSQNKSDRGRDPKEKLTDEAFH
jgi:hypothetical protein